MKKAEIIQLQRRKCDAHGHDYLSHYNCYLKEQDPKIERIGFFDLEASGLVADYGQMLSWAVKDGQSEKVYTDYFTPQDLKDNIEDKRIIESCIDKLMRYDKIVTYFGSGFDFPFLRARALITKVKFPKYGSLLHKDLYFLIRSKFKISSRRLENACKQLIGASDKTKIESIYWRQALRGDSKAISYVVDHNIHDVEDLEKLYYATIEFQKGISQSI